MPRSGDPFEDPVDHGVDAVGSDERDAPLELRPASDEYPLDADLPQENVCQIGWASPRRQNPEQHDSAAVSRRPERL